MGKSSSPPRGAIIRGLATRKRDIASENVRDILRSEKSAIRKGRAKRKPAGETSRLIANRSQQTGCDQESQLLSDCGRIAPEEADHV
jgi:hypothetical protein